MNAIETVSSESGEILSLDQFKRELGMWDAADDSRAELMLESARNYCERISERTLRLNATRTYSTRDWPSDGWLLRHPPVTAVSSITYYDADNAEQTFSTSNYQVNITAEGYAHIEYTTTATLPVLYDRQDAVTVTYTCGYATEADAPAAAKYAIILVGQSMDETASDARLRTVIERQAMSLLHSTAAPTYA